MGTPNQGLARPLYTQTSTILPLCVDNTPPWWMFIHRYTAMVLLANNSFLPFLPSALSPFLPSGLRPLGRGQRRHNLRPRWPHVRLCFRLPLSPPCHTY